LTSKLPDVALRLRSDEYYAALADALRMNDFDAVQVEGLELAPYISDIRRISPHSKIILDCHNAETELQRRAFIANRSSPSRWPAVDYSGIQVRRLARFEKWSLANADGVMAVSREDKGFLEHISGGTRTGIVVVPNTIDVGEYAPSSEPEQTELSFDL